MFLSKLFPVLLWIIFMMKPIYEDITPDEDDIPIEILEDITSYEDEVILDVDLENITSEEEEG
uniref:Uncharacterized protein n=1 Tax=Romanomermis culicivorax TaxID=13658 RepID=A0A915KTM2_ROMCU